MDALAEGLGLTLEDGPSPVIDRTRYKRRLVISVIRGLSDGPADRIDQLHITLRDMKPTTDATGEHLSRPPKFLSWDRFSTVYNTVDLGKLTLAQTSEANLSLEADPTKGALASAKGTASYKYTKARTEEVDLHQRYVTLGGSLSDTEAELFQESVVGLDLAGTSIVDVDISTGGEKAGDHAVWSFSNLWKKDGSPTDQKEVIVSTRRVRVPEFCAPITVTFGGAYRLRHVACGDKSISESDDCVEFYNRAIPDRTIELVSKHDLDVHAWEITDGRRIALYADGEPVRFASYDGALAFLAWLNRSHSSSVANRRLTLSGQPLSFALGVRIISLNCSKG